MVELFSLATVAETRLQNCLIFEYLIMLSLQIRNVYRERGSAVTSESSDPPKVVYVVENRFD